MLQICGEFGIVVEIAEGFGKEGEEESKWVLRVREMLLDGFYLAMEEVFILFFFQESLYLFIFCSFNFFRKLSSKRNTLFSQQLFCLVVKRVVLRPQLAISLSEHDRIVGLVKRLALL